MKVFLRILCLSFLVVGVNACVSVSGDQVEGEEELAQSTDDADVEKTLEEMGGPIEEGPAVADVPSEEAATPSDEVATEQIEAIQSDDVESYKLDDSSSSVTPVASSDEPLEANIQEERQPDLDLSAPLATEAPSYKDEDVATSSAVTESYDPYVSSDKVYYSVRRGESLSMIAKRFLGSVKAWKQLAKHNRIRNANLINAGDLIEIPVNDHTRSNIEKYVAKYSKSVKVKRGDTLAKIASRVLGHKRAWKYLWKNNEHVVSNPHRIEIGTVLNYLAAPKSVGVARKAKAENATH